LDSAELNHIREIVITTANREGIERPLLADFVAEVGDDKSVAAGANFLS